MKKRFSFFGVLVLLILTILSGCEKDPEFDPSEVVVTIDATGWINSSDDDVYVVMENSSSTSLFVKAIAGEKSTVKRGDKIKGDLINIHFVYVNPIDNRSWKINSFNQLPLGKEIPLLERSGGISDVGSLPASQGTSNITFSDIPAFDVVTRNANIPQHAHTLATLEVPCAAAGGNTYPIASNFFISLTKDGTAAYKLIRIPESSDFQISLSDLSTSMTKYSIPKVPGGQPNISVTASGSDGGIEIFSLQAQDVSIFSGNNVDIFVPTAITQMQSFTTTFTKYAGDSFFASGYVSHATVQTNYSMLNLGLAMSHTSGKFPVVTLNSAEYDYLKMEVRYLDEFYFNTWTIYAPDEKSLKIPVFPAEVTAALSGNSTFTKILTTHFGMSVIAVSDSRISSYEDAAGYHLDLIDLPLLTYTLLTERFNIAIPLK